MDAAWQGPRTCAREVNALLTFGMWVVRSCAHIHTRPSHMCAHDVQECSYACLCKFVDAACPTHMRACYLYDVSAVHVHECRLILLSCARLHAEPPRSANTQHGGMCLLQRTGQYPVHACTVLMGFSNASAHVACTIHTRCVTTPAWQSRMQHVYPVAVSPPGPRCSVRLCSLSHSAPSPMQRSAAPLPCLRLQLQPSRD